MSDSMYSNSWLRDVVCQRWHLVENDCSVSTTTKQRIWQLCSQEMRQLQQSVL